MTDVASWLSANWKIITAVVAVIAPSTTALVAVMNSWREARSLEISLLPDKFHHYWETERFAFTVRLANPAKYTNSIKEWTFLVSGTPELLPSAEPADFIQKPISSGEWINGQILVSLPNIFNHQTIGFSFHPVRGRRRTFTFTKRELLTLLGLPPDAPQFRTYGDYRRML